MNTLQNIVFFGTHELAVPALEELSSMGVRPSLIVTQPEAGLAPVEGDAMPAPHPVLDWAAEHEIKAIRTEAALEDAVAERIAAVEPDLLLFVDYGAAPTAELLELAKRGGLGIQPSLLPKMRGPHAVRGALDEGLKKTGVSAFRVDGEPWAGPVLLQEEVELDEHDTFRDLMPRIVEASKTVLSTALTKLDKAKKEPKTSKQNEKSATHSPPMDRRHRRAPWSLDADSVYNRYRAHDGLVTSLSYRPLEILSGMPAGWVQAPYGETGTFLGVRQGRLAVLCGDTTVFGIDRVRRPGGEIQSASAFAHAEGLSVGDRFV